jgi:peptidoglycan hydrolase-like protein with peptidoglycan-binding domain
MARITEMPFGIKPVWVYDVTHPVSWRWFQYRDDVLLLQYALNRLIAKQKLSDFNAKPTIGPMGPERPPLAPLKVDGIFGNKTHAALMSFQRHGCIKVDGEVDSVHEYLEGLKGDPISPRNLQIWTSVMGFTMFRLNSDILELYGKMMDDMEMPPQVQAAIRESMRGPRKHWR